MVQLKRPATIALLRKISETVDNPKHKIEAKKAAQVVNSSLIEFYGYSTIQGICKPTEEAGEDTRTLQDLLDELNALVGLEKVKNKAQTEIMRLLIKFYGVDSIAEATELITAVKVGNQVNALKDYLNELGMSRVDVVNYMRDHRVRAQLHTDSKLQNMAIDKLKAYFDKH